MDNLSFVKRFIAGTKNGLVTWEDARPAIIVPQNFEEGFYTEKDGYNVIIMRTNKDTYTMIVCRKDGREAYRIDEKNLSDDLSTNKTLWSSEDQYVLSRLFRLAERNAKKIDELLEYLTMDLPEEHDLPF